MRHTVLVIAGLIGLAVVGEPGGATTAREVLDKGKALDDTTRHWTDRTQRMVLTIYDASGAEKHRELTVYTKRYPDDEEKTISFFTAPPEERGIGFLQWAHKGKDDDQWLYLPQYKRTRRIASGLRDESFVGTDFTYRDLEVVGKLLRWSEAEAPAKLLGEASVDGAACYQIELRPQQEGMPYQRLVLWMEKDRLTLRKLEFYDITGTHNKALTLDDVRDVGAIPTPRRLEMRTLTKGSHTAVELPEVSYNTGLQDELFTQRYLEREMP